MVVLVVMYQSLRAYVTSRMRFAGLSLVVVYLMSLQQLVSFLWAIKRREYEAEVPKDSDYLSLSRYLSFLVIT